MSRLSLLRNKEKRKKTVAILTVWLQMNVIANWFLTMAGVALSSHRIKPKVTYEVSSYLKREYIRRLVHNKDTTCTSELRMNRRAFYKLCEMLENIGGLKPTRFMLVDEQVGLFLHILSHHQKNRTILTNFQRSGETVSRCFHKVLDATMRLQGHLFKKPKPVLENCDDERWKWFKNCLGALDGTYIKIKVLAVDRNRYRSRKGDIATNVLGACTSDMQFTYVLPGWEGSAADGRVLRDAISRRNGLKVPHGCYYLVDAGYANSEGFLAPFRGQRYHLSEWREGRYARSAEEFYNMKHSAARNVIERCFGVLKLRWGILRCASHYPARTHNRIIIACCLLHNFIRMEHEFDPFEAEINETSDNNVIEDDPIIAIEPSEAWTTMRMELANEMFNTWKASRN
ncbi:protein ALP1-like [Mercurialis annua]|uniref:protein ALP1-like n=1 Tax=Mercurialis annua TaxID=3986 RepID=UPI0021601B35|nr:protein ALP1-like [Mercurialis annua]